MAYVISMAVFTVIFIGLVAFVQSLIDKTKDKIDDKFNNSKN